MGHVSTLYLDSNYFKVKNIIHFSPGEQFKTYSTSHNVFMSFVKFHNHMLSLRIIYSYLVTDLCMVRETYNLAATIFCGGYQLDNYLAVSGAAKQINCDRQKNWGVFFFLNAYALDVILILETSTKRIPRYCSKCNWLLTVQSILHTDHTHNRII